MGLDVYIYRCPDIKAARFNEAEYEKASEAVSERLRKKMFGSTDWKAMDGVAKDRKEEFWRVYTDECEPLRQQFGMKEDGYSHQTDEKIEMASTLHPEHYFKIGYFRSSYNEGGFNSYARRLGIPDLKDIFDNEDGEYQFTPDWQASKDRAVAALAELKRKDFGFDVVCIDPNLFTAPSIADENQALACFKAQFDSWNGDKGNSFDSYENRDGWFIKGGYEIHAAIPGTREMLGRTVPCTYLIHKRTEENWYAQALEIVIETCNWVLEQPNRDQLYMHWSG